MRHIASAILFALCACYVSAQTQATRGVSIDELRNLLSLPAPVPRTASDYAKNKQRPFEFFDINHAPPDDAPVEDLLDYWERHAGSSGHNRPKPSDAVRQRLLAACEAEPERLPRLLNLFSDAAAERVKRIYDQAQSGEGWRESARQWLQFNSRYFLEDLLASARKVRDKDSYVENEESLRAIARHDWPDAEPLLKNLSNDSSNPRSSALAAALLYRHAVETKDASAEQEYRERLQAIAADRNAPARARDTAIDELSLTSWQGRDEWYLSLFADETLLEPRDGNYGFSPLTTLFYEEPDKWIPVMTRLVESKDRAVQQAAASCLVQYTTSHRPRRDAILPVLRWLSDPDWLDINGTQYAWFMQKMDEVAVPESVPGLIWIVEHDESDRRWAARTLAYYKDSRAIPALKKALAEETDEDARQDIIHGLLASGGVPEAEQLAALEAYAAKLTTSEGRKEVDRFSFDRDEPLPPAVSIGLYLARKKDAPDSLATKVIERAESLRRKNPALSRALFEVAEGWQARRVDLDLLRRIAQGDIDAASIANALERREKLRERVAAELQTLAASSGAARGIASVLLEDEVLAQGILGSRDIAAQTALIACARLTQMALPVADVGALLASGNPVLALAAERYLLAEDSKDARQLLWAHHPNRAFITGWRENIPLIGGDNFDAMGRAEERLRAELFKENGPLEIFALIGNSEQPHRVVRVFSNKAVCTYYEDSARYRERIITEEELEQMRGFIIDNKLAELGPQIGPCHHDCFALELVLLARQGGRRVFTHQSAFAWITVHANFDLTGRGDGTRIHYYLESEIKGLKILHADEKLIAKDVWQKGADLRVLVERPAILDIIEQEKDANDEEDDDEESIRARRRQQIERQRARLTWRAFTDGKPGEATTQPEGYSTFDEDAFEIDPDDFPWHFNGHPDRAVAGRSVVLAGSSGEGLWKKAVGQKAVRISGEGTYANPLVTPDGRWVVAAKTDSNWAKPNYIVRFDLQTLREYRVNLPVADDLDPIAYIDTHGKVLLRRARDKNNKSKAVGPEAEEFYLLDVATGQTQLVSGVFAPLQQTGNRFLQPTARTAEFWAAIPDRSKDQTRVGRYNLKDFSFQTALVVPRLVFDSFSMWVDEPSSSLYIVYEGQLLRLPFQN